MIIATAGHVDHGKTLLVKALTGVDTDRLPEEKKRNLTIDLGFAYLGSEASRQTIGFIDVPGHERFVRNALCGLAGTDFVLLVIAADDGPMPQTREHLAIVDLLGVARGAVALTKCDRASAERIEEVSGEIRELLQSTSLADIPIFPVSALEGIGVSELKEHLEAAAAATPPRPADGNFRLAVDRRFDVTGAGMIVTGTVFSGHIAVGDNVRVLAPSLSARVRGIHAQNTASKTGRAGQRCALNITGADINKDVVARGDWITMADAPAPVAKFDAELRVLESESRSLKHWTPVHVHLGAAETTGRVAVLQDQSVEPGGTALAQLVLEQPIGAVAGNRFIIRDQSARRTIGGGRVIDIFPPGRGRAKPERIALLEAMRNRDHTEALTALMDQSVGGVDLERFRINRNLTREELNTIESGVEARIATASTTRIAFAPTAWTRLRDGVAATLKRWHAEDPAARGWSARKILSGAGIVTSDDAARAIAEELARDTIISRSGADFRLPSHTATLSAPDQALWELVEPALKDAGSRPMTARELEEVIGKPHRDIERFLGRAGRQNLVIRISKTRYAIPDQLLTLARVAATLSCEAPDRLFSAAQYRDASGIGRNLCIEILEFFDQQRFTHRTGNARSVLVSPEDKFGKPGE
jgi:selenocysteine-specific elongation factor